MKKTSWVVLIILALLIVQASERSEAKAKDIVPDSATVTTVVVKEANDSPAVSGANNETRFNFSGGLTSDGKYLYAVDENSQTIQKIIIATGETASLADTNWVSRDGKRLTTLLKSPQGITTDGLNLYVADTVNNTIRKIDIGTGIASIIAGEAGDFGSIDGKGSAARFGTPYGITTDGINLYVADTWTGIIRKVVISTGDVTTLAGKAGNFGSLDGRGAAARFGVPYGITTDGKYLYVVDNGNATIRKIDISTGEVTTFAGKAGVFGSSDGTGSEALFFNPRSISTDGACLYVSDSGNGTIRKIDISTGAVSTLAGSAGISDYIDGNGHKARFRSPHSITMDGSVLYVADESVIRKIQ